MIVQQAFAMCFPHDVISVGVFMVGRTAALEGNDRIVGFPTRTTQDQIQVIELVE